MKLKHTKYLSDLKSLLQKKQIVSHLQSKLQLNQEEEEALFDQDQFKSLNDKLYQTLEKMEEIRGIQKKIRG